MFLSLQRKKRILLCNVSRFLCVILLIGIEEKPLHVNVGAFHLFAYHLSFRFLQKVF